MTYLKTTHRTMSHEVKHVLHLKVYLEERGISHYLPVRVNLRTWPLGVGLGVGKQEPRVTGEIVEKED